MNTLARRYHRLISITNRRPRRLSVGDLSGNSPDPRRPLGSPLQARRVDRLCTTPPNACGSGRPTYTLRAPEGTSCIGRGARDLSRSASPEALTGKVGVSWIRAAESDVTCLFGESLDDMRDA